MRIIIHKKLNYKSDSTFHTEFRNHFREKLHIDTDDSIYVLILDPPIDLDSYTKYPNGIYIKAEGSERIKKNDLDLIYDEFIIFLSKFGINI